MKEDKSLRQYIIFGIIALVIAVAVCFFQKVFNSENTVNDVMKILCNAFSVSGVLIGGIGVLSWVSGEGGFHMLGYSMRRFAGIFARKKENENKESYIEYVERKNSERNNHFVPLLIIGGIDIIISLIFYLFYRIL